MATYTWASEVKADNTVTVPDDATVTDLPSSPSGTYGTIDSLIVQGAASLTGGGSVLTRSLLLGGTLTLDGVSVTDVATTLPSGTITIQNGASFIAENATSSAGKTIFTFGVTTPSTGNSLYIQPYVSSGVTINNVAPGDYIYFTSEDSPASDLTLADGSSGIVYIYSSSGILATLHTAETPGGSYYKAADFSMMSPSTDTYELVCFLPGSMIRTKEADIPVEDLRIGDSLLAFDWHRNSEFTRTIVWVGSQTATVNPTLPPDEAGYPVRILKDAISDGLPYKDMLITPDHCLFFEDKFIPARMLVNGRSIFYDREIISYTYYHIETDKHAVITADGMLTESYLDTGNRSAFRQHGETVIFGAAPRAWVQDAAAPLCVARDVVEPIYRQIAARAEHASIASMIQAPVLTDDADLHLVTEKGMVIRPVSNRAGRSMFMLPAGVTSVRIVSRASRPSDTVGPFVDDRRHLGVLIREIMMLDAGVTTHIKTHLTDDSLDGWAIQDAPGCRWTSGNALLPLGTRRAVGIAMLAVQTLSSGPYLVAEPTKKPIVEMA